MRQVENISLEIEIESAGEAMDDTQKATADMKRILQKVIDKLDDEDPEETGWVLALHDINGNKVGSAFLNIEEKDWISDWDEWIEHCKEYIRENGFYLEQESTTVYEWDTLAELDETALAEWFSNYTDSAVTREEVCPEARNWGWDS